MKTCHLCRTNEGPLKKGFDETGGFIRLCSACCLCTNCGTEEFDGIDRDNWRLTKDFIRPAGWIFQDPSTFQTVCYYELYCSGCKDLWCASCLSLDCVTRCEDCCAACSDPCECLSKTNSPQNLHPVLNTISEGLEIQDDRLLSTHPHQNSSHGPQPLPMMDTVQETLLEEHNTSLDH